MLKSTFSRLQCCHWKYRST